MWQASPSLEQLKMLLSCLYSSNMLACMADIHTSGLLAVLILFQFAQRGRYWTC